jgi:cell division protein FtsL
MWRSATAGVILVVILLYSAWQHFELIRYGYRISKIEQERADELKANRRLRLSIQTLSRPDRIEKLATKLRLAPPSKEDTVILERVVPGDAPAQSVVAQRQ